MDFNTALQQVRKDEPSCGDVHVPAAGGDGGKKDKPKARGFKDFLTKRKPGPPSHTLTLEMNDGDQVKSIAQFMGEVSYRSRIGHSFVLEADREDGGNSKSYPRASIDGDGGAYITRVLLDGKEVGRDPDFVGKSSTSASDAPERFLQMHDANTARTPFQYDRHALSDLRPDQVPRFLAALTDADTLPTKSVPLDSLYAMQNRVDPAKVDSILGAPSDQKPVVVRFNGKNYIADGHHRLAAAWLNGDDSAEVRVKNIGQRSNALKRHDGDPRFTATITKADPDQRRIFGWANIIEKNGKTVVDTQGDWISEPDLEEAFYDYVKNYRDQGEMHQETGLGQCIEMMVFTKEKQDLLGIDLGFVGAWVGLECSPALFAKIREGLYPCFSIGGEGIRLERDPPKE